MFKIYQSILNFTFYFTYYLQFQGSLAAKCSNIFSS